MIDDLEKLQIYDNYRSDLTIYVVKMKPQDFL
jgi:hypothetical protein